MSHDDERRRRWTMALGVDEEQSGGGGSPLSDRDKRMSAALGALYDDHDQKSAGSLSKSNPRVAKWLGDIREFFPTPVVQVIQKDAYERRGLRQLMMEPEFLETLEADVGLVADLVSLRHVMPDKAKNTARIVVQKVVNQLMEKLQRRTAETIRGAVDKSKRTSRPRFADIDWGRTIAKNLRHYQTDLGTIIPESLVGFLRRQKRNVDLDEVVLCVDQSGSMGTSVVYSSIFAAVMATLPVVKTKLVCFDTVVHDMTDDLADPVDVLFGIQLGGGTDINRAVAYCEGIVENPSKAHLVLITDLYENGVRSGLLERLERIKGAGVNVIVLLALTDTGRPSYDAVLGAEVAALDIPVFACTPDQFPGLMATALRREDVNAWASNEDIKTLRAAA
jgi:Mg-chelatase subunit ChlD